MRKSSCRSFVSESWNADSSGGMAKINQPWPASMQGNCRAEIRSFLQKKIEWKIVFEACDGLEAVQKTLELRPDIVLMDIQMPGLNGIEAAKRIRQFSPDSKIIILTQNIDDDLMAAALQSGASAYVVKSEMTTDLIPAVQAALWTLR